jgi:hypothetical protein
MGVRTTLDCSISILGFIPRFSAAPPAQVSARIQSSRFQFQASPTGDSSRSRPKRTPAQPSYEANPDRRFQKTERESQVALRHAVYGEIAFVHEIDEFSGLNHFTTFQLVPWFGEGPLSANTM